MLEGVVQERAVVEQPIWGDAIRDVKNLAVRQYNVEGGIVGTVVTTLQLLQETEIVHFVVGKWLLFACGNKQCLN